MALTNILHTIDHLNTHQLVFVKVFFKTKMCWGKSAECELLMEISREIVGAEKQY